MAMGAPNMIEQPETVIVGTQDWLDAEWHFRMQLPASHRAEPGPARAPGDEPQRLARYELGGGAEIDVMAAKLYREVDAGDWLAASPVLWSKGVAEGIETEHRAGSAALDAFWERAGVSYCGRICCLKSGPRMFLISCSAREDEWPRAWPVIEAALESFEPVQPPAHRYAEPLREYRAETPIPWTTSLPASWLVEPGTKSERAASFQAENMHRPKGQRGEMVGKLAFAVLSRSLYRTPRDTVDLYLDAVREHGIDIGDNAVVAQTPRRPYEQAWSLSAPVWRDELPGEVRCRVLLHEKVWVLAGVLSVRREEDVMAWMENKRALDVVTRSLRFES